MKRFLKKSSALLAVFLLLTTVTACGSNQETTQTTTGSNSGNQSESTTTNGEAKTHTLSILGPDPGNPSIKYDEREEYEVWTALQDLLAADGITLEIEAVPLDQYEVVIQTRMSSSSLPDIANMSPIDDASIISLGKNGVIQELSSLIETYSNGNIERMYTEVYDTGYPLIKTAEGEIYWLTNLHKGVTFGDVEVPQGLGLQIRQDWLDKLDLEMPTTLDEFTETIKAFRSNDVNENGSEDEIILIDAQTFANGLAQVFGLGNGILALDPETGEIVTPWYQDNIKEYFAYLNELITEGLVDAVTIGSWDLQSQRLADNLVGAWYAYDSASYLNGYVTNVDNVDYEPIFILDDAVSGSHPVKELETSQLVWDRYAVTKAAEDQEGVIKFFDLIYSDEYSALLSWGIEGKDYTVTDGVRTSLISGMSNDEKAAAKRSTGSPLWGGILPRVQIATALGSVEEWQSNLKNLESKTDIQIDAMTKAVDYEHWIPLMLTNFLAMATDEETEIINRVQTGIETYSDEMSMKLALGTASLDDFDSFIEELKELGLDELIAVQQARHDRFAENSK